MNDDTSSLINTWALAYVCAYACSAAVAANGLVLSFNWIPTRRFEDSTDLSHDLITSRSLTAYIHVWDAKHGRGH